MFIVTLNVLRYLGVDVVVGCESLLVCTETALDVTVVFLTKSNKNIWFVANTSNLDSVKLFH